MDTDALRWFQQVADGTTVTEVSDLDGVTQSGVSRALARLETEVGTALLRRQGRVLRMTRAGSAFKHHVDALLHELDDGLAAVNHEVAPDTGTVGVAFQGSLGAWLVADLVASFRREHPDVRFDLRQTRDELIGSVFSGGRVDLHLTTMRPTGPDLRWRPLQEERLRLVVNARHRLVEADRAPVLDLGDLADLAGEPFATLRPSYQLRQLTDSLCRAAGFTPTIAFEGDDVQTVLGLVAAGLGVAVVPQAHRTSVPDRAVRYLDIDDPAARRTIGVAWLRDRRLLPAAEQFRQHVLDHGGAVR